MGAQFKGVQPIVEGKAGQREWGCSFPFTMREQRVWKRAAQWSLKA